jgi:hypothetical protein
MEVAFKKFDTTDLIVTSRNVVLSMSIEVKTSLPSGRICATPDPTIFKKEATEYGISFGISILPNNTFSMQIFNIRTLRALNWAFDVHRRVKEFYANNTGTRYMIAIKFDLQKPADVTALRSLSHDDVMAITFNDGINTVTYNFETGVVGARLVLTITAKSHDLFQLKRRLVSLRANRQMPATLRDIRIAETQSAIDALRVEMSHGYYPAPSVAQVVARQNQARANDQRRVAEALARHATPANNNDPNVPKCPLCCEKILDERPIQFKNGDTDHVYHAKCAFQATIERRDDKYPYQQKRMSRRNMTQVLESPALRQWQTSRATRTSAGASSSQPSTSTPPA